MENNKEITVAENNNADIEVAQSFGEVASGQVKTTVDMSTEEGQDTVYDAITDAEPLNEHLEEPIALKDIVFQGVELTTEQGEIVTVARTILIDDKGKSFATVSETVIRDLHNLIDIKGAPSKWTHPQVVEFKEVRGKKGNRFYKMSRVRNAKKAAK